MSSPIEKGQVFRHTDTGDLYDIISVPKYGRKMSSKPRAVVYRRQTDGEEFYRSYEDFATGKFERVQPSLSGWGLGK